MTDPNAYWQDKAKQLVGKTVSKVVWVSEKSCEDNMWDKRPVKIIFTDGSWIIPLMDDEGNNGGALAYKLADGEGDVLPVI